MVRKCSEHERATTQRARFIETTRQLGADEDETTFKAKLAVIARQKAKDEPLLEPEKTKA